jgi:hypothetical protein
MNGYGKNGSDYEKTQAGDTENAKKMRQLADSREFMKTSLLVGNRRMRRSKKDNRSMER